MGKHRHRAGSNEPGQSKRERKTFFGDDKFLHVISPLSIDPRWAQRIAASCYATNQHFDRACGLLREMRHDFVRGAAEFVAVLRLVTLDEAIGLAFVVLGST